MEKFVPYQKLSKAKKKELNNKKRASWGAVNPVTRKVKSSKIYDRKKSRKFDDYSNTFGIYYFCA